MLLQLQQLIEKSPKRLTDWFEAQWKNKKPELYLSCDIRHSGHKIAVVDTNLFPAGFNNLCPSFSRATSESFRNYLKEYHPSVKKILLFAEEHTRNKFYLQNVAHLKKLLELAGYEICVGILGNGINDSQVTLNLEKDSLTLFKIRREDNQVRVNDFLPDLVISNNDFSAGIPEIFKNLNQSLIPGAAMGWHRRRKILHFEALKSVLENFAKEFSFDPWFFYSTTDVMTHVQFSDRQSMDRLAQKTEEVLGQIREKYQQYHISETPYVYLKSNRGTYGMGLLPVFSGEEVLTLNRRQKNKLLSSKGGLKTDEFLIQEGIPTADTYSNYPIEPVIYAVGKKDVGGFFRIHESKNELESLNAPGMTFSCLCLHKLDEPHERYFINCGAKENIVTLAKFLTRVAALAVEGEKT